MKPIAINQAIDIKTSVSEKLNNLYSKFEVVTL
jgi:hypothetical protein